MDDHAVLRDGLANLLSDEADLEVVAQAGSSAEALEAAHALTPDVLILDHRLPDGDGISTAEQLRALSPTTKVVMFTAADDRRIVAGAAAAGCAAFVNKGASGGELVAAVRKVAAGEAWPWDLDDAGGNVLTSRERAVLELAAAGLDNYAIAERLFLSVNTVRNHFQHVLVKLDAHSKLQAVAIATRLGLVSPPTLDC